MLPSVEELDKLYFLEKCYRCQFSYSLIGTNFYYDIEGYWCQTIPDCKCNHKCCCPHDITIPENPMLYKESYFYRFEEVFEKVPEHIQEQLVFHLDLFLENSKDE